MGIQCNHYCERKLFVNHISCSNYEFSQLNDQISVLSCSNFQCDHCYERKLFGKHISCRMVKLIITPADAINNNLHFTAVVAIMSLTNSKNWNSHNTTLCIYEALISLDNDYYRQTLLFSKIGTPIILLYVFMKH